MCVIVFKPAGAECPSLECLESCWDSNPDGAGLAVSESKKVFLQKGFMSFAKLRDYYKEHNLDERVNQAMMFHFRIGTHGKKDAGNTHPFPVSSSPEVLRSLFGRHDILVAHNGIFNGAITLPDVSDTGQFLADCAADCGDPVAFWHKRKSVTGWSRMVVLKPGNRYSLLGEWHCDKDCGCFFSNASWKIKKTYTVPTSEYNYGKGAKGTRTGGSLDWRDEGYGGYSSDFDDQWEANMTAALNQKDKDRDKSKSKTGKIPVTDVAVSSETKVPAKTASSQSTILKTLKVTVVPVWEKKR